MSNAAFAGVMLEISFAKLTASMAMFNEERVPSRPFCSCELVSMTRSQGGYEMQAVKKDANPNRDERPPCHRAPRTNKAT